MSVLITATKPRAELEAELGSVVRKQLSLDEASTSFFQSGRAAIHAAMVASRLEYGLEKAIVPNYICNVVHRAAEQAKMRLALYSLAPRFEPDLDGIVSLLRSGPAVVVLASLYGNIVQMRGTAEALLSASPGSILLFDHCQAPWPSVAELPSERCLVVVSFNGKAIHGLMGGAVLARPGFMAANLVAARRMSTSPDEGWYTLLFGHRLLSTLASRWLTRRGVSSFSPPTSEYSTLSRRHYQTTPLQAPKLVLAASLAASKQLARLNAVREGNVRLLRMLYETGITKMCPEKSSPYHAPLIEMCGDGSASPPFFPAKGPYRLEASRPAHGLSALMVFRNDGLWRAEARDQVQGTD